MSDLPSLPAWAKTLQRRIRQRGIDFFILHGPGVRDLHPLGARRFGTIADCLAQVILNDRSAIVTYDRGAGIGFSDRDVENDFKTVLKAYDKLGGTNLAQVQPRDPDRALQLIETYLRYQLAGNPRFSAAVIIDFGETVAPAGEPRRRRDAAPLGERAAVPAAQCDVLPARGDDGDTLGRPGERRPHVRNHGPRAGRAGALRLPRGARQSPRDVRPRGRAPRRHPHRGPHASPPREPARRSRSGRRPARSGRAHPGKEAVDRGGEQRPSFLVAVQRSRTPASASQARGLP